MAKRVTTVVTTISKISDRSVQNDAALVVIYGPDLGRKYDVTDEELTVGRSSSCDIQIDQEAISRKHARVVVNGKTVTLVDLGSTNGTYVNDERVDGEWQLRNGDLVKIGRTVFKYLSGGNIEGAYHDEIYRLTTVDGLTQVSNRRFFEEALEREVARCRRHDRLLALALIDIDRFKQINDTFGHLAGDYVLKHLARTIQGRIRREDVFARYGGEEFALLLPELDLNGARQIGEKVRKLIEKEPFDYEGQAIPTTVSIGVAVLEKGKDGPSLVKEADTRLYEAKTGGRNRVVSS